ncbi:MULTISPECIES: polysaccharide pyruvyl transferase family protein [Bacteroidaceae]|uniref:Polysaccharide pyruvyl transferase domain-containing protein n=1 Tax=Bacteroides acidifaciens TaxID=85831 RepID=A0A7J0A1Y1_9BACE|nr:MULTISPECIES: polysaccharide pyruvyl transferase family protein [Bacteroidaceae]GFH86383.1 hypothetical protein IMSAGC001_01791 [Bacteroides acidifaciens]
MRIKTITCHRVYNHGAALQAWALATYLKRQGHDVEIIDYRPDYLRGHYELRVHNPKFDKPIVRQFYLVAKYWSYKQGLKRKAAFDTFDEKFIAPLVTEQCYLSAEELKNNPPQANVYIAGSDQIWNTKFKNGTDPSFYLDFGNQKTKRLSYAASFATQELRLGTHDFVNSKLMGIDAISVREPSGVKLLNNMGYEGTLVCDPVFLIDEATWVSQIATKDGDGEKYVLVYDFENSKDIQSVVKRIAKHRGWKIYSIGPYPLRYVDKDYVNYGPDTFVGLIKNAACVVSNSFHATAFSFIFKRNLLVVKRADGLNTRMQDLLGRYGIIDRLVDGNTSLDILLSPIDYDKLYNVLQKEIEISKSWLINSLER